MFAIFNRRNVNDARKRSLAEAAYSAHEHQEAAEHHAALARMYAERVARLKREQLESMGSSGDATVPAKGFTNLTVFNRQG